jgi:ferrochelatase
MSALIKALSDRNNDDELGGQMSFLEHLDELRRRLVRSFVFVFIAAMVSWFISEPIYSFLAAPVYRALAEAQQRQVPIAALQELDAEVRARDWKVELREITGWHRHPGYLRLRADAILSLLGERGLSLADPETKLVFSAHGTPLKYLEGGSRYDLYVQDFCASLAEAVDAPDYALGYQNHTNRPGVEWTQPDVGHVIEEIEARRVVVDPVSFMHEQSETLAELDHELRGEAEARGLEFHRVPIPYAAPAFIDVLADLVEGGVELRRCRCREGAWCLNG